MTRVLAFSCSRHRPMMLRCSVLQMAMQTYPCDYSIYINSDQPESSQTDYTALLTDISFNQSHQIFIGYGPSYHQHINYFLALEQVDIDNYDLFLKIDDDDLYRTHYVADIVCDYEKNRWDFSGTDSQGVINGKNWYPDQLLRNIGSENDELCYGVTSTWAFSKAAVRSLQNIVIDPAYYEDALWKRHLETDHELKLYRRSCAGNGFHYHVHGQNTSTYEWLDDQGGLTTASNHYLTQHINPYQAIRIACRPLKRLFQRIKKAVCLMPSRDIRGK